MKGLGKHCVEYTIKKGEIEFGMKEIQFPFLEVGVGTWGNI